MGDGCGETQGLRLIDLRLVRGNRWVVAEGGDDGGDSAVDGRVLGVEAKFHEDGGGLLLNG
jgi:hypothetical protein